jgi:hypothetical protein
MRIGNCRDEMTAERRQICQTRNLGDRLPGGQARSKDRKVDVLQYPGEENPAGTICLAPYSYQIQRDPLLTPQLCRRRAGAIAFEEQLTKRAQAIGAQSAHARPRIKFPAYCETTSTAITPACFVTGLLRAAHGLLIFFETFLERPSPTVPHSNTGAFATLSLSLILSLILLA